MKQLFIALTLSSLLMGCAPNNSPSESQIKMSGSTTLDPIMNLIIETYKQENPAVSLSYEALGSSVGIRNLLEGTVDVAGSSRDLTDEERAEGLTPYVIGLDGLAVIANVDAGVTTLSKIQLANIFSGKVTNWRAVGGRDLPVTLVKRDESSGTYTSFKELVLKKEAYASQGLVVNSNGDAMSKVTNTTGSIGYIGMSYVSDIDRALTNIIAINNILPNEKTIKDTSYPLSRQVYLVAKGGNLKPAVRDLLTFVLSPEGQELVASAGFFPFSR